MKAVHKGNKIFDFNFTTGGSSDNVVNVSFIQSWYSSSVLFEDLFLDVFHKQTCMLWPKLATHCN